MEFGVAICICDLAKQYKVKTDLEACKPDCPYMHYDQLPQNLTSASVLSKVKKIIGKLNLSDAQSQHFLRKIETESRFATMCRYKQSKLAHNRLSTERIFSIFGPTGTTIPAVSLLEINTFIEFATYGITPIVSPSFKADAVNVAPLRDRYIKLQHTINKLLYKLYSDGTMILLRREDAM